MTNYCAAIAALFAEHRRIPRITADTDRREQWRIKAMNADIHRQERDLQTQAAKEFAALNGWRHTERGFAINTLARGGTHETREEWLWRSNPLCLLDHGVYFREIPKPYCPMAVVGQPYDTNVDEGIELAHSYGLELHAPQNLTASWWYPNHARFFCLTRPGVSVHFLLDQLTSKHTLHVTAMLAPIQRCGSGVRSMDEDERDYDQELFETALWELVHDARAHDVDMMRALALQLCSEMAVGNNAEFAEGKERMLWVINRCLRKWPDPPLDHRSGCLRRRRSSGPPACLARTRGKRQNSPEIGSHLGNLGKSRMW